MSTIKLIISTSSTATQELNDANGVNMPFASPSVEKMNRIISYGAGANAQASQPVAEEEQPAFGTHIREAVAIVRDWKHQER